MIVGVSGSGKSTLLHIISGILDYEQGVVNYLKENLKKKDVTAVLQTAYLFGDLTVNQNIMLPSLLRVRTHKKSKNDLIDLFKLQHIKHRKIRYCSGGERARTNLVRGLITKAPIIVVDEPTANVDYENAKIIVKSLVKLAKKRLIIATSHQPHLFNFPSVKKLKLVHGKIYES